MRTKLLVAAAVLLLIAGGAFIAVRNGWIGDRTLRIASILPLTGPDAAIGLGMRNSIRLAVDEANARGGVQGRRVVLVELDSASQPATAAAAARKVVDDPRVIAALGTYDHECYMAVQPILGKARVPWIPAAIADRDLASVGLSQYPSEFALIPFGSTQMAQAAKYAWDVLGARTFMYVHDGSNYALFAINHFRAAISPYLKTTATGEELLHSEADLPALVAKIKAAPPQYVFFAGKTELAARFLKGLREAGVTSWFQSGIHSPAPEFIDLAKDRAEGALDVFAGIPPEDFPEGRQFLKAYAAQKLRDPPSIYGVYAYAETQILLQAMERSFLTRPSVSGSLKNGQFDTVLGPIRFNWVGSSYQTAAIYQVVKGRWTPIYATDQSGLKPFTAR